MFCNFPREIAFLFKSVHVHNTPLVSIITLNYNNPETTNRFLRSSTSLRHPRYEIIVADMASSGSNLPDISLNANARMICSNTNLGFAEGNNMAARQSIGEYLFFVNNDTLLNENLLEELITPFEKDSSIGITCPKIVMLLNNKIEYAGFNKMKFVTGRTTSIGYGEIDNGQYNRQYETNGAHGCALMIRKELFQRVGGFPSQFFLYYEEWDISERIKKQGYKILFVGTTTILHEGSVSIGKENPLKEYYLNRNRILFIRRNANVAQRMVFYTYLLLISIPKNILAYLIKGQINNFRSYLRAIYWNFTHSVRH